MPRRMTSLIITIYWAIRQWIAARRLWI